MILIFILAKSKSSQNKYILNQNHSNQNELNFKIKIMPISAYLDNILKFDGKHCVRPKKKK